MNKQTILYAINAGIYFIFFLLGYVPNLFDSLKIIILKLSSENLYFLVPLSIFTPTIFIALLYLFLILKKDYNNKLTLWGAVINLIATIPLALAYSFQFILGKKFFMEEGPGFGISLWMAFFIAPALLFIIGISILLLVVGIVMNRKDTEEGNPFKRFLILFFFIINPILYFLIVVYILLLIVTIISWRYMFFQIFALVIVLVLLILTLRFMRAKMIKKSVA